MKQYHHTSETATVSSYPYGRLRTQATFGLEFNPGKGFRTTFQTINPKSGRVNAVKKSTYSDLALMYTDTDTGHISYSMFDLRGEDDVLKVAEFMAEHFDLFTPDQVAHVYRCMLGCLGATAKCMAIYSGANIEQIRPILKPATDLIVKGLKEGLNYFEDITIDTAALDACRVPDFQAFKVSAPISIFNLNKA